MKLGYQEYLDGREALTLEEAVKIISMIQKDCADCGDEDSEELFEEMMQAAVRYANIRAGWNLLSKQKKMDTDSARTSAHDSIIIKVTQLMRYFKMQGIGQDQKPGWYELLGYDKEDPWSRKRVGDFACYAALLAGLNAR